MIPKTPKGRRVSVVTIAGGTLTLAWAVAEWAGIDIPEPVVSAATALAMVVAGLFSVTAKS